MKFAGMLIVLSLVAAPALAQVKPCDELKGEIEAKLTQKGVVGFSLTIVASDAPEDGKVVGTCEGGSKKILYKRRG
jgi:hypothetical protein